MGVIEAENQQRSKKPKKVKEGKDALQEGHLRKKKKKEEKDLNEEKIFALSEESPQRVAENRFTGEDSREEQKKKRKRETEDKTAHVDLDLQHKKKKHRKEESVNSRNESCDPDTRPTKQDKKKKIKGPKSPQGYQTTQPETKDASKKKSKGRKSKMGFPDPDEDKDSQMSSQARKALSYAFSQTYDPKRWKFNKGRQNWLIRNFWSTEAIPEKYESLIVKYLSGTQGGSRDNLIATCRDIVKEYDANEANLQPETSKTDGTSSKNLGGALIDTPIPAEPTRIPHKRRRAELLLAALSNPLMDNGY